VSQAHDWAELTVPGPQARFNKPQKREPGEPRVICSKSIKYRIQAYVLQWIGDEKKTKEVGELVKIC